SWRGADPVPATLGAVRHDASAASYDGYLATLETEDAARLRTAVAALRESSTAFTTAVSTAGGDVYEVEGRRTSSGDSVVWIAEISAFRHAEDARASADATAAKLRAALDALPVPVWRRGPDLRVVDCNDAYAAALDLPRDQALAQAAELAAESGVPTRARAAAASGEMRSEERHVVVGGSRRLLKLTEAADHTGGTIGFAIDRTDLE